MFCLEIGRSFKYRGENWEIRKIHIDSFLAINEFGFNLKRFPILKRIKQEGLIYVNVNKDDTAGSNRCSMSFRGW